MIPQAGSAYAYSYATLGELVAWIIGWDLILEYAVGNVAVAISWGDYFKSLLRGFGLSLPAVADDRLPDRAAQLRSRRSTALLHTAPRIAGIPILSTFPAFAIVMLITWLLLRGVRESARANNIMVVDQAAGAGAVRRRRRDAHQHGELPCRSRRTASRGIHQGAAIVFFAYIGFDAISTAAEETEESAAQPADRHPRRARDLHRDLRHRRLRADGHGAVPASSAVGRSARARAAARRHADASAGSWRSARWSRWPRCCSCSSTGSRASSSRWRATACCRSGRRSSIRRTRMPYTTDAHHRRRRRASASLIGDAGETYDLTNIGTLFAFALVCIGVLVLRVHGARSPAAVPGAVRLAGGVCSGRPRASS